MHRYVWNLRGIAPTTGGGGFGGGGGGNDDDDSDAPVVPGGTGGGAFVVPGTYRVALSRRVGGNTVALGEPQTVTVAGDPALTITPAQRTSAMTYQDNVAKLQRTLTGALEQANNMKTRTTGDPPRPRRFTRRREADGRSGALRSPRHRDPARAARR